MSEFRLVVTRQYKGWFYAPYMWEILNPSGIRYDYGFSWTVWGAKWAAHKSLKPTRRKPDKVVFEKQIQD